MKTSKLQKISLGLVSAALVTGCSTDPAFTAAITEALNNASGTVDNITGKAKGTPINAQFLDAAVSNLQYKSNTYNGFTNGTGNFQCASGEVVEFVIGSASLGTSICQGIITPQTLAAVKTQQTVAATTTSASGTVTSGGTTVQTVLSPVAANHPSVVNRVRLLMSLDSDSDATNGIQLPPSAEQAAVTQTFTDTDYLTDTAFVSKATNVLAAITSTSNRSLVDATTATKHFNGTVAITLGADTYYNKATGSYDQYNEVLEQQNAGSYGEGNEGNEHEGNDHEGNDHD